MSIINNLETFYHFFNGKFDFPIIKKQKIDLEDFKMIGFNYARSSKEYDSFLHFFLYDYQFERVWNNLKVNENIIKKFKGALSPDFSLFCDFPLALQIYNVYRNRFIGSYLQDKGLKIIPTISWSDERSFEFCFDGVEEGCIVSVSSLGVLMNENTLKKFKTGYNKMIEVLKPEKIIIYGQTIEGLEGDILYINPFFKKFREVK